MPDPIETAEHARQAAQQATAVTTGGLLGGLGLFAALVKAWTSIFGARKARAEADAAEDAPLERAARLALDTAKDQREETVRTTAQRDAYRRELEEQGARLNALEKQFNAHLKECGPQLARMQQENARMREENARNRKMLRDYMNSTPPAGVYSPDDVRKAQAAFLHDEDA